MASPILKTCMNKGFLLDKEVLKLLGILTERASHQLMELLGSQLVSERVITLPLFKKYSLGLLASVTTLGDKELISFLTPLVEKEPIKSPLTKTSTLEGKVKLLKAPAFPQKKIEVHDFVKHFRSRYGAIRTILEKQDLEHLTSIRKIGANRGTYTIIASVISKRVTNNKNLLLEVEDLTGTIVVLVNQNKKEVFEAASDLLLDDIVAFNVSGSSEMLFANEVIFPEASLSEKKYGDIDEYLAVVGDLHCGSTMHLHDNLMRFIKWVNGEEGDESQRELAKKVKYLFFTGDNIDGVNHYPGQEPYLNEKTSIDQYKRVEEALKLVRKDVQMIMIPGQHDAVWVGEPQPIIPEKYAPGLHAIENLSLVPNPSIIEIDCGFKILMYHGASINVLIEEIPEIRLKHGHNNPTRVVKEMIKRSHLSSIHGQVDYIPCENDPLVLDIVPDIIITGDQHRAEVAMHNNILLIAGSCFQSITPFEERVGNVPDPCKIPLFNLKTREIKILDFSDITESTKDVSKKEDLHET